MTTFNPAQLPNTVNTVEEVLAWSGSVLAEVNPNKFLATTAASLEPVVQVQTFRFTHEDVSPERLVVIAYLPLVPNWRSQGKLWSNGVAEISTAAIPPAFSQP